MSKTYFGLEQVPMEDADVVILESPYEYLSEWKRGASYGPKQIRTASESVEVLDYGVTDKELTHKIHHRSMTRRTRNNSEWHHQNYMYDVQTEIEAVMALGKFPVIIGGDQSTTAPCVMSHFSKYTEMGIVYIDSQMDIKEVWNGSPFTHASTITRILDYQDVFIASVGVRSMDKNELVRVKYREKELEKMKIINSDWFNRHNAFRPLVPEMKNLPQDVYLTVDLDALDLMVSCGTPDPGGLLWNPLISFFQWLFKHRNIVALELMELRSGSSFKEDYAAAKLLRTLLCLKGFTQNT